MADKVNDPKDRRESWKRAGAGAHAAPAFAATIMTLVAWALLFDDDEENDSEPSK